MSSYRKVLAATALVGFFVFYAFTPYLEPYYVKRSEQPSITGFFGLEWGSTRSQVQLYMKDLEQPPSETTLPTPSKTNYNFVIYEDLTVLDVTTHVGFLFNDQDDLIMGFFLSPFDVRRNDCEEIYRTFRKKIEQEYPSLSSVQKQYNSLDAPLCHSVTLGKAGKAHHWSDPRSLAQIHLTTGYGLDQHVLMITASPKFVRWIRNSDLDPTDFISEQILSLLE